MQAEKQAVMREFLAVLIDELSGAKYVWWDRQEILPDDSSPFWMADTPVDLGRVKSDGLNCAGLINIIWRHRLCLNAKDPDGAKFLGRAKFLGGGTEHWGEYLQGSLRLMPASHYGPQPEYLDLLFSPYESVENQGHLAVALGDGNMFHVYGDRGCLVEPVDHSMFTYYVPCAVWLA